VVPPGLGEHGLDAGVGQDLVHEGRELGIPVSDQAVRPAARILQTHHEILDRLNDPARVRVVPSTRTRLAASSMTARMCWRCPFTVLVSMKPQAGRASAGERRKSAHVADTPLVPDQDLPA
jgi:hypothetical protein